MANDGLKLDKTEEEKNREQEDDNHVSSQQKTEQAKGEESEQEEGEPDEKSLPSQAAAVHERIRADGKKELERDGFALLWSAIAAGITMSSSMVAKGLLQAHLPDSDVGFLVDSFGYTLGFILVILARQQLFTENTVTAVLPVMSSPTLNNFGILMRLWGVVLLGNVIGSGLAATTFTFMPMFDSETHHAFLSIGHKVMENSPWEMFSKGVIAGWLIATMVWVIPSADQAKVWIILLITYVVAIGDFTHIIVGATEITYLVLNSDTSWTSALFRFGIPVLLGNIIGGTFIFALISHAQIRNDMHIQQKKPGKHGLRHKE
ncbi:formate/nitrite transporter family protein [Phytohalomonas tamaricis]|uniref:formate/nitrite transporter family protein n=1 Tax=Phytohalomonas tamaricis TaxID=2081032 RepID=UPI000D0B60A1|nr:formate/nitrite transporter family protein [Phytohalomonas tamaricis]